MPDRYKAKLEDRSWHQDASREGKALKEFIEDQARPKSKRRLLNDYVEG